MSRKDDIIRKLINPGIIAVVRARSFEQVRPLSEALVAGGVTAIEITMTTPNAIEAIREMSAHFGDHALIGVGTVIDKDTCHAAITAGAEFVVSPITRPELIEIAHSAERPIMLGAYTPTEAQLAHESGSDFVKIFPADGLGAKYIKGIRAPLPHLRVVPTGGVNLDTATDFLNAGCAALGVGSSLLTNPILTDNRWDDLTELASKYVAIINAHRGH